MAVCILGTSRSPTRVLYKPVEEHGCKSLIQCGPFMVRQARHELELGFEKFPFVGASKSCHLMVMRLRYFVGHGPHSLAPRRRRSGNE